MKDQRPDQSTNKSQPGREKVKQEAPSVGQHEKQQADQHNQQHAGQQNAGQRDKQQQAGSSDHSKQQGGANSPGQHAQGEQKPKTRQTGLHADEGTGTDHKPVTQK